MSEATTVIEKIKKKLQSMKERKRKKNIIMDTIGNIKKERRQVKRTKVKEARKELRRELQDMKKGKRDVLSTPKGERTDDPNEGYKVGEEYVSDSPSLRREARAKARKKIKGARREKRKTMRNLRKLKKRY